MEVLPRWCDGLATYGKRHSCHLQRRPDPALDGPEMRQTFIMGLALRSVVPLEMLDVRLPEEDWIGELSPNHGASCARLRSLCRPFASNERSAIQSPRPVQ